MGLSGNGIWTQYIVVELGELQLYIVENCHFPIAPFNRRGNSFN